MQMLFAILMIALGFLLWSLTSRCENKSAFGSFVGYRGYDDDLVCKQLASDTCQVAEPQLQDCWLNKYRECTANDSPCNCASQASKNCLADAGVAKGCYASFYAKCMASRGLGPDPDR
jgi:hypothetical protein